MFYEERCPRYDELLRQVKKSDEYLTLNSKYKVCIGELVLLACCL